MARQQLKHKKKKPLIVICSEGGKNTSEWQYFKNFADRNLRIQFSSGNSTDPQGMLNDLLKYIVNEDIKSEESCRIFLIIDTDLSDKRINEIKSIESECRKNNIEIITSAPTFEIWYLMHYRKNKLKFSNSKEVKKELENINGKYSESMNMYPKIIDSMDKAIKLASNINRTAIKNEEDLYKINPHSNIYKVIEAIENYKE